MLKKPQKQAGSLLVIGIIIFVVAVVTGLGYVVWSNYIAPKPAPAQNSHVEGTITSTTPPAQTSDPNEGYLVLNDWGVKFKIPDSLASVKYYKLTANSNSQGVTDYYELTTDRVEALGGQCAGATSNGEAIRLDSIERTQTKQDDVASGTPANNNEPLAGYYYYVSGGQSVCSDQGTDIQTQDRNAIYNMLLSPVSL